MFNDELKNKILNSIAESVDLTDLQHDNIKKRYNQIANYLNEKENLQEYKPELFSQGSVALGTETKPLKNDEYDIDIVCKLTKNTSDLSPNIVKTLVGNALKKSREYSRFLQNEGKRCWTLSFNEDNYHLDILPAIITSNGLKATEKINNFNYKWKSTNPEKYILWFKSLVKEKKLLLDHVEPLVLTKRKNSLQKTVQLLKMHRNNYILKNNILVENKPISIIITTLCGYSYEKGNNIIETLDEFVNNYKKHIIGDKVINPVNKEENFADKWTIYPERKRVFYSWIENFCKDYAGLKNTRKIDDFSIKLYDMFGEKIVKKPLYDALQINFKKEKNNIEYICPNLGKCDVTFKISAKIKNESTFIYDESPLLDKHKTIIFHIETPVSHYPHSYFKWQITNCGREAFENNQLRGNWEYLDKEKYDLIHEEKTLYTGTHFVRCAQLYKGEVIGYSNWLIIKIK